MSDNIGNFRSAVLNEPLIAGGPASGVMRTPLGNVRALGSQLPPSLPPPPSMGGSFNSGYLQNNSFGYNSSPFMGGGGGYGYSNGYGGFGNNFGGGFGGGYGGYGGSYNRFGTNPGDPEQRLIQLAENSSRPAFQSIESLVSAIGNIASMLDSTFFALTSSFRAILGVAANFGRLRSVFAQFWQTFAIFRAIKWIYRKMLYWLRISNLDPSSMAFKEAFSAALSQQNGPTLPKKGTSPWPVLAFISFIFTAPYLIMKLIGTVTDTALEESRNPEKWVNPIETNAVYNFQGRNTSELSFQTGQRILVAPKEIQNTHHLMNTGWGLATIDGRTSGLVPITYLKSPSQMRQEQSSKMIPESSISTLAAEPQTQLFSGLGVDNFAAVPSHQMESINQTIPTLTDSSLGSVETKDT